MRNRHFFSVIIPLPIVSGCIISILALLSVSKTEEITEKTRFSSKNNTNNADTNVLRRQIALKYCQNCHLFPEPDLLDKKTWTSRVLPNMGMRLGIKTAQNPYADLSLTDSMFLKNLGIYPDSPIITKEEWLEIIKYYEQTAPSRLFRDVPSVLAASETPEIPISSKLPQFKPQFLTLFSKKTPQTTLLKFDKTTMQLYVGDAQKELYVMDSLFRLKETGQTQSPATDIDFPKNKKPRLLTIGTIRPSDQKQGQWVSLDTAEKKQNIYSLQRPVSFATSDLNKDGKEDLIIAQFGNNSGKLSWFDGANIAKEHILKDLPGARKVVVADMNGDKKPDIVVLMAQAYEQVTIFYNQGKSTFKEKTVLQFPPVYGVSYFELVDFNKDGFQDILLTNGDNWDYSAIKKPYHGIRLFLNDGHDNFKQAWFYPLFGTSKAMARDFDGDGDLDIAAIAFYTELDQPEHSFLYLKNEGNLNFTAFATPEAANGKWLTMEIGDFDNDGDEDIALGSYFHNFAEMTQLMFRGIETFPQLLILKNQQIQHK